MFIVGAVLALVFAPTVNQKHPPDQLAAFFGGVLGVLIMLAIGLYLLQRNNDNERIFRFLGVSTIMFYAVAIVASAIGLLPMPDVSFRFIFAATVAGGVAGLTTFGLVATTNILEQRKATQEARLNKLSDREKN
jgi:peptidoglycan/LPS O-acetylase OafA/YrhL